MTVRDSVRVAAAAERVAAERDEWNKAEVVKRLTEAGLVVADGRKRVGQEFLSQAGDLLQVSGSDLQIYIYPSAEARRVDSAKLDTARAAPPGVSVSWAQPPHLIVAGNMIAIHLTPRDHLAERVADALTARHAAVP